MSSYCYVLIGDSRSVSFFCCCTLFFDLNDILLYCGLDRNQHPTSLATQDPGTHLAQPHFTHPLFGPAWFWAERPSERAAAAPLPPQLVVNQLMTQMLHPGEMDDSSTWHWVNKKHSIHLWYGVFTQDFVDVYCKCIVYMDLQNALMDFYIIVFYVAYDFVRFLVWLIPGGSLVRLVLAALMYHPLQAVGLYTIFCNNSSLTWTKNENKYIPWNSETKVAPEHRQKPQKV